MKRKNLAKVASVLPESGRIADPIDRPFCPLSEEETEKGKREQEETKRFPMETKQSM